jgi:beta-lactam-binding protein with PASTA domain
VRRVLVALVVVALIAGAFGSGYYGSRADDRRVPNLLGSGTESGGQAAARHALAAHGLRLGRVGWMVCTSDELGLVVRQNPPAGTVVPEGAKVNVAIGRSRLIFGGPEPCLPGKQQPVHF